MTDWLTVLLNSMPLSNTHKSYLQTRGVNETTNIDFKTFSNDHNIQIPCPRFKHSFGIRGERLNDCLIIPVKCPRDLIIGFEARTWDLLGNKKVYKYMLDRSQWLPTLIGSKDVVEALWGGGDVYLVEGVFDLVALKRVIHHPNAIGCTLRAGIDDLTLSLIERFASKMTTVFMCYDNDSTGRLKNKDAIFRLSKIGVRANDVKYRGKDPNELWTAQGDLGIRRYFMF